jgi:hypothetical protein
LDVLPEERSRPRRSRRGSREGGLKNLN